MEITAEYLEKRREDVRRLREALANGEDEATAAHRLGFATRNDVASHVEAIRIARAQ